MEGAGLVHMKPALCLLACLDRQRRGQSLALAPAGRKRLDGPNVGHGVDQLATGKIGLLRPGTVQGPAPCTVVPHRGDQPRHQDQQHHRHPPIDGEKQDQGPQEIDTRGQDAPGSDLKKRADTLGGCRDPAAQGTGQLVGEEAQSMAGEVFEEVEADVDAGGDHAVGGEQTAKPPEHALQADQHDEQHERPPHPVGIGAGYRHGVDQQAHAILDGDGAARRADHQAEQAAKQPAMALHMVQDERNGARRECRVAGMGCKVVVMPGDLGEHHTASPRLARLGWGRFRSANWACWWLSSSASDSHSVRRPASSGLENRPHSHGRSFSQPG